MTYTADSPAVLRAAKTWLKLYAREGQAAIDVLAVILSEHKRGLHDRLATAVAIIKLDGEGLRELTAERDAARSDALRAKMDAVRPAPAAVVLPEITDEDAAALRIAYYQPDIRWESCGESSREEWRRAARTLRDRLAASLPVWQPVEPGTVIKAGTLVRRPHVMTADGTVKSWLEGPLEFDWICGTRVSIADSKPIAEPQPDPVDPDADVIEDMAAATARCDDYEWTHDLSDSERESYRVAARAALAAYRAHIEEA